MDDIGDLSGLLVTLRPSLQSIAEAWLQCGAEAFGLWSGDCPLFSWPEAGPGKDPWIGQSIRVNGAVVGDLRVSGLDFPWVRHRLAADAALLQALIVSNGDVDDLAAALLESQDHLLAVFDLERHLSAHLDFEPALNVLAYQIRYVTHADLAFIIAMELGLPPISCYDPADAVLPDGWFIDFPFDEFPSAPILLDQAKSRALFPGLLELGDCLFLQPLKVHPPMRMLIGLQFDRPAGQLSPELKLVQAIARQAEIHFENVFLHQKSLKQTQMMTELDLARNIQAGLLPETIPPIPGIQVSAHTRPALEVGGDFFDFISLSDGQLIVAVGDASGKGMPAALLMSMIHTVIHSAARFSPIKEPAAILKRTIQDLYDDFNRIGLFATVFIGQVDILNRSFRYGNAGHSPVIYCPAGGRARLLKADTPPVGIFPDGNPDNFILKVAQGDVFLIGSDGFSDAMDASGSPLGIDYLLELAESLVEYSADRILEEFFLHVEQLESGQTQFDDQTLLVIKIGEA